MSVGLKRRAFVRQKYWTQAIRSRYRGLISNLVRRLPPQLRRPLRRLYDELVRFRPRHAELELAFVRMLGSPASDVLRARRSVAKGPRVLLATNIGNWQPGMAVDTVLGAALTLRGARVDFMQCDALLPACQAMEIGVVSPRALAIGQRPHICSLCTAKGRSLFDTIGLPRLTMSELIDEATRDKIASRVRSLSCEDLSQFLHDTAAGEQATAGALRFFARGDLSGERHGAGVLRRYMEGSLTAASAVESAIDRNQYDVVVAHHGIYVPQGIVNDVCRRRGVRLVTWNPAYRRHCFIFSHDDTYHHTMITEPTEAWENLSWTPELEHDALSYLNSRWHGDEDWIQFHSNPEDDMARICRSLDLDRHKPYVTLLTNVVWDAQLHYPSNAFPSMLEWIFDTIQYFARRPEINLVIRVHPAEITGFLPSRQPVIEEVARRFPKLPENIRLVPPASTVSTYALCENSNAVLIYNTKTGIETAAKGIPTVVAGDAWIRNKGFCWSPVSSAEYFSILDQLPFRAGLNSEQTARALRYAYHIFFRRMIPLPFISGGGHEGLTLDVDTLSDLAPDRYQGLDIICDGILKGSPFVYPAEKAKH